MVTSRRVICRTAIVAAAGAVAFSPQAASAVDIVVQEHPKSFEIQYRSSGASTPSGEAYRVGQAQIATGMRVGFQSGFATTNATTGVNGGIEAIMFFQIPAIPAGQQLTGVSLKFDQMSVSNTLPDYNVDLYAVGFDKNETPHNESPPYNSGGADSVAVAQAFYYLPTLNTDVDNRPIRITNTDLSITPDAGANPMLMTRIQDNILDPDDWTATQTAGAPTLHSTDETGNANLLSFINALYARSDFTAGDYLILRMNPDQKATSSTARRYQIPYNDVLNPADALIPELTFTFTASAVPGDADGDGDVDLDDQGIWASNFTGSLEPGTGTGTFGQGDFDSDKDVDLDDQGIWASNFTGSLSPGGLVSAVPEPAAIGVFGMIAVMAAARRRRG